MQLDSQYMPPLGLSAQRIASSKVQIEHAIETRKEKIHTSDCCLMLGF